MATATAPLCLSGFVQLRRGIIEHLADGRLTADEFAAFSLILLKASHHTGKWKGSGRLLGLDLRWQRRKAERVLASLRRKQYLSMPGTTCGASHWIVVNKYSPGRPGPRAVEKVASPETQQAKSCVTRDALPQEVVLKTKANPAAHPAAPTPTQLEQVRKREARDLRLYNEGLARAEAYVGTHRDPATIECPFCFTRMPFLASANHHCPEERAYAHQ